MRAGGRRKPHDGMDVKDVPNGWAKMNGEWFRIECVNWHPAACRLHNKHHVSGAGSGMVLMPKGVE